MIQKLEIYNFKSIKELFLDCKRINVFIGKPNVGKSNILEGISMFRGGLKENIRQNDVRNIFYDQDVSLNVKIKSNDLFTIFKLNIEKKEYEYFSLFSDSLSVQDSVLNNDINPLEFEATKDLSVDLYLSYSMEEMLLIQGKIQVSCFMIELMK
ncbi:MAG: AAA family ATPase [Bacteroidia bacterium]